MLISKNISKQSDVVQKENQSTTPQQFEEDHIQLMTMNILKLFEQIQMKGCFCSMCDR